MDPVHDYQNFLHILSLTLIKHIRFRKKYFIPTSILFRESYSRWVCLRIPNITALGIVANWNFYLGKCLIRLYNAKFGIVNDINYGTPFYIIFN